VEAVGDGWIDVQQRGRLERIEGIGAAVVGGRSPLDALYGELVAARPELELHLIGDARRPRDLFACSHEAADAVELIHARAVA
jgi:hypothetical protein